MATAFVKDYVLWAKHIRNDPGLVHRILEMRPGETIKLTVDGIPGTWAKMAAGRHGAATPGLRPLDTMKQVWGSFFRDRKDEEVVVEAEPEGWQEPLAPNGIQIEPPLARSEEERQAALRAFLELAGRGWRSTGPYGPRDELYER